LKIEINYFLFIRIQSSENDLIKKKAPATDKNVMELLRWICNFAVKRQLCNGLSFTIEMPEVNNLVTEDLRPEQLSRLLQAIAITGFWQSS
jgi:hypothetical protein